MSLGCGIRRGKVTNGDKFLEIMRTSGFHRMKGPEPDPKGNCDQEQSRVGADRDPGEVYADLRRLAECYMSRQRRDHTLQPTALVHEAYLRLLKQPAWSSQDRALFLWTAARAMRSVLVDHARRRGAIKRQPGGDRVPLDDAVASYQRRAVDLVALDEVLEGLTKVDPLLTRIVDLRFFGGMTEGEIAASLDVTPRTVRRKWRLARQWLHAQLTEKEES